MVIIHSYVSLPKGNGTYQKTCCLFDSCLTFSLHELYSQEQKDQEGLGIKHWFQTPSMSKAEHVGICIFLYCGWEEKTPQHSATGANILVQVVWVESKVNDLQNLPSSHTKPVHPSIFVTHQE